MKQQVVRDCNDQLLFPGTLAVTHGVEGHGVFSQASDASYDVAGRVRGTVLVLAVRPARGGSSGFAAVNWALVTDGRVTGWIVPGLLRTLEPAKGGLLR